MLLIIIDLPIWVGLDMFHALIRPKLLKPEVKYVMAKTIELAAILVPEMIRVIFHGRFRT